MTAGKRDSRITFQRFSSVQNEYGEEVQTWAPIGEAWAAVYYGKGDERRQAAREQGGQAASFAVLSNAVSRGIKITDRIVMGADNWDVTGISPVSRREIEFTAKRAL